MTGDSTGGSDEGHRVLVIEDSEVERTLLCGLLEREGFDVAQAATGEAGLALVPDHDPDVVVLDLVLPRMDGLSVCRAIRERSNAYIIILSSKSGEVDRVVGLTVGADDYVTKPFSPPELVARVRACLRRPRVLTEDRRTFGPLELDLDAREVTLDGEVLELTPIEYQLLALLTARPGSAVTRDELIEGVWGGWTSTHTVDVHVSKLRRKLGDRAGDPRFIQTLRGVGYRFVAAT